MDFVPLPNCIQLNMRGLLGSQKWENVFHYATEGEYAFSAAAPDLADAVIDAWNTDMKASVSGNMYLSSIYLTDQSAQDGPAIEYSEGLPLIGTVVASEALPFNAAAVVKKLTGKRGRSYRGRTYFCGWTETYQNASTWNGNVSAACLAFLNDILYIVADEVNWQMQVASRIFEGAPREVGELTPVIGFTFDTTVASQRRRLPGRGQ